MRLSPLLAVMLLAAPAGAQAIDWSHLPPLTEERPFAPPRATRLELGGGGTLLVVENHDLPLVTTSFVFAGAGAAADPADEQGLAGYTADLLDEGAGGLDALTLAQELEHLGTSAASWAEEDAAFLSVTSLADKLPRSLELAGKIVSAPTFDPGEARRVHEDRMTGIELRRDRPGAVAYLILERALHGASGPYGHPILGTARGLAKVTLADAQAFYRARYGRDKLIVVVAGDVVPAEARRLVERALSGFTARTTAAAEVPLAAPRPGARLLVVDREAAEQSTVLVGAVGLRRDDPRAYAFDVLTNILGGTFTSRLTNRLREQLGYTYAISAYATYLRQSGTFVIDSAINTPHTGAGLREIYAILARIGKEGVTEAELDGCKRNLVRGLPLYFAANPDIADAFASRTLHGLPDDWFERYGERVDAVSAAEVKGLAASLLASRGLVTVVVGSMAAIRKDLGKLGLGRPALFDPDGELRR